MGRPASPGLVALFACAVAGVPPPASGLDLSALWGRTSSEPAEPVRRLDLLSTRCIACHAETAGDSNLSFVGSRLAGHPVGLAYREAWLRRPRSLRAPVALNPSIALPAGRITCLSCHMPRLADSTVRLGRKACPSASGLTRPRRELCVECHLY